MKPQLKLVPGRHYDQNEPWAREPRLRPVVERRGSHVKYRESSWRYLLGVAIGYALAWLTL